MNERIAVVALNPCVDTALYLSTPLTPGGTHRILRTVENPAGKGLNQALMFQNLGAEVDYFAFGSEDDYDRMNRYVQEQKFRYHRTVCECGIRQNVKIIDKNHTGTEFNQKGGPISDKELMQLVEELEQYEGDILSLCGSIPQGVDNAVYKSMLEWGRSRGMITVLDADGEALRLSLEARPTYIKPNRREFAGLFSMQESVFDSDEKIIEAGSVLCRRIGVRILCTLDADGALYIGPEGVFRVSAIPVKVMGFAGAGDSFLTAFLWARQIRKSPLPESLNYATRVAAAKVSLGGSAMPDIEQIGRMPDAKVRYLGELPTGRSEKPGYDG